MALQETVIGTDGQTLYAPTINCRPLHPERLDPKRREMWDAIREETGLVPPVYPNSTFPPCERCGIEIVLGPRAQTMIELATEIGLASHAMCMFCVTEALIEGAGTGQEVSLTNLGNPYQERNP